MLSGKTNLDFCLRSPFTMISYSRPVYVYLGCKSCWDSEILILRPHLEGMEIINHFPHPSPVSRGYISVGNMHTPMDPLSLEKKKKKKEKKERDMLIRILFMAREGLVEICWAEDGWRPFGVSEDGSLFSPIWRPNWKTVAGNKMPNIKSNYFGPGLNKGSVIDCEFHSSTDVSIIQFIDKLNDFMDHRIYFIIDSEP
jgi:hypothetical protein